MLIYPRDEKILIEMGKRIKLARLRRNFSMRLIAERADISRVTLYEIEKGSPTVSIGAIINVLKALNLQFDMNLIAKDDELGRTIQDLNISTPKRANR